MALNYLRENLFGFFFSFVTFYIHRKWEASGKQSGKGSLYYNVFDIQQSSSVDSVKLTDSVT